MTDDHAKLSLETDDDGDDAPIVEPLRKRKVQESGLGIVLGVLAVGAVAAFAWFTYGGGAAEPTVEPIEKPKPPAVIATAPDVGVAAKPDAGTSAVATATPDAGALY